MFFVELTFSKSFCDKYYFLNNLNWIISSLKNNVIFSFFSLSFPLSFFTTVPTINSIYRSIALDAADETGQLFRHGTFGISRWSLSLSFSYTLQHNEIKAIHRSSLGSLWLERQKLRARANAPWEFLRREEHEMRVLSVYVSVKRSRRLVLGDFNALERDLDVDAVG